MKLILSLTLIWSLCSSAEALQCLTGINNLTKLQTCDSDDSSCKTTHVQGFLLKDPEEFYQNVDSSCASSSACALHGQMFSYRTNSAMMTVHCCDTDGCNTAFHHFKRLDASENENGLQCFTCSDPLDKVCNMTVKCLGVQDRCMDATASDGREENTTRLLTGCVSANMCEDFPALQQLADAHSVNSTVNIQCCGSSFCNSAWTAELSAAPLLFGLIVYFVL